MARRKDPTMDQNVTPPPFDLEAEYTALRDRHQRLLVEQRRDGDEMRAAARRSAWDQVLSARGEVYYGAATKDLTDPVTALVYQYERLPDKPKICADVKWRARWHADRIREVQRRAANSAEMRAFTRLRDETKRLRGYVTEAGQKLHVEHGGELPCRCVGCELIRGMDREPQ